MIIEQQNPNIIIGQRIKALRENRRLNQEEIAELLNIARATYARYESGKIAVKASDLMILAKYFGVQASYFDPNDDYDNNDDFSYDAYLNGMPPEVSDPIKAMIKAAHAEVKRRETTHGNKAE